MPNVSTLEEKFWAYAIIQDGCWGWKNKPDHYGYALISRYKKLTPAHRVSYEIHHGPIPDGHEVDHACRNKICTNPAHLRLATRGENRQNLDGAQKSSKSGVRGVWWSEEKLRYRVQVRHNKKLHHVGYFTDIDTAEAAAIAKRLELFTHNAEDRKAA